MTQLRTLALSAALALVAVPSLAGAANPPICRDLRLPRLNILVLDRVHSALSETRGYKNGFVPFLADDVLLLAPGLPVLEGKDAAAGYFAGLNQAERLRWTPTRIDASADGKLGTSWGWTETRVKNADGTTTTVNGRNMVVWKLTSRGWRVAVYLQAASAPPQPTPEGFGLFPEDTRRCYTPTSRDAVAAEVAQADTDFAALSVAEGYGIAFKTYAAADAVIRAGGFLFIGPDAIYSLFGDTPPEVETLDWAPTHEGGATSGDLGWTVGTASDIVFDPSGDLTFFSKYVTLWQRQPDGSFLYVADGGNAAPGR